MRGERARCDEISSCPKHLLSAASYRTAVRAGLEIEGQQVATVKFFLSFELFLQENIKSLPHYPSPGLHLDICRSWARGLMMCHWILQWIYGRVAHQRPATGNPSSGVTTHLALSHKHSLSFKCQSEAAV